MKQVKHRMVSSTLLEVVVAMIIVNIVFFMCFTIILNALGTNKMMNKNHWQLMSNNILQEVISEKNLESKTIEKKKVIINKKIEPLEMTANLYKITIVITDKKRNVLAESKCISRDEK